MSYSQRKLAQSYLDYVSNNKSRNEYVLTLDKKDLRNFMAENGIEWTPQEIIDIFETIETALNIIKENDEYN